MHPSRAFHKAPVSGNRFAAAGRTSVTNLKKMVDLCLRNPITRTILESVDGFVLVLNEQRQILAANSEALQALNIVDQDCIAGMRPGEAFHCIHSCTAPLGCGATEYCATCGAAIAVMTSQKLKQPASGECLMTVARDHHREAHEFSVRATPLNLDGNHVTIVVMRDISAEKRREVLEMVFLHDLNNVITGLRGWSELLLRRPRDAEDIARNIADLSKRIAQELKNQRMVLQAEKGELKTAFVRTKAGDILKDLKTCFADCPPDEAQRLKLAMKGSSTILTTCPALLTRVLLNMVKNALEATSPGDQVRVRFEVRGDRPCFVVHNPGKIPEHIARQMFKRSFSTKDEPGRGLGTYSMKLFGEQYLGGEVGFTTSEAKGTSFYIILPAGES